MNIKAQRYLSIPYHLLVLIHVYTWLVLSFTNVTVLLPHWYGLACFVAVGILYLINFKWFYPALSLYVILALFTLLRIWPSNSYFSIGAVSLQLIAIPVFIVWLATSLPYVGHLRTYYNL